MSDSAVGIISAQSGEGLTVQPFANGREHLLAEFERLRLMMTREVLRLRASHLFNDNEFRGLYISDEQVDAILTSWERNGFDAPAAALPSVSQLKEQIEGSAALIGSRARASAEASIRLPLVELVRLFGLSPDERDVVVICAAPEIDLRFETLYAYTQNDVTRKRPTVDLILRLLFGSQDERMVKRELFSSGAVLQREALIRAGDETQDREMSFLARALRAEERIVEYLLESTSADTRIKGFTSLVEPERFLEDLHFPIELMAALNRAATRKSAGGRFVFHGARGSGRKSGATAFGQKSGRSMLIVNLRRAVSSGTSMATIVSVMRREAILRGANIFLDYGESLLGDEVQTRQQRVQLEEGLPDFDGAIFVGSESPWPQTETDGKHREWLTFDFPMPAPLVREQLWLEAMKNIGGSFAGDADLHGLAGRFALTGGEILNACRSAREAASLREDDSSVSGADLELAARAASTHGLHKLAHKVKTIHDWSDLVLPPRYLQQLREVCLAEKYRHLIYTEWGFDQRLAQGKGLNVLFCGPSGTGKTMSAGIISRDLGLDLYKIDLSTVVSKYIGETEKQLSQIFRAAASSNAILFFDEADALFGKRSEVKDAHDRYANVEVAYLLQKMEEYEGIVILATNFRKNIDEAFTRRIHYILDFPFPSAEYREKIWRSLMPSRAPVAPDVDFGFLGRQFELAGGNIRNVALAAAFLAADQASSIRMEHFIRATSRELQKLGKLASRTEFGEFYELTREPT